MARPILRALGILGSFYRKTPMPINLEKKGGGKLRGGENIP